MGLNSHVRLNTRVQLPLLFSTLFLVYSDSVNNTVLLTLKTYAGLCFSIFLHTDQESIMKTDKEMDEISRTEYNIGINKIVSTLIHIKAIVKFMFY